MIPADAAPSPIALLHLGQLTGVGIAQHPACRLKVWRIGAARAAHRR